MFYIYTGRGLVDLLASLAGGANKFLQNILFADIEGFHLLLEPSVFFFAYCKSGNNLHLFDFTDLGIRLHRNVIPSPSLVIPKE